MGITAFFVEKSGIFVEKLMHSTTIYGIMDNKLYKKKMGGSF